MFLPESVFLQGASGETAAAPLMQVIEAEKKRVVVVEIVMALHGKQGCWG